MKIAWIARPVRWAATGLGRLSGRPRVLAAAALSVVAGLGGRDAPAAAAGPCPPAGEVWLSEPQVAGSGILVGVAGKLVEGETVLTGGRVAFDDDLVAKVMSPVAGRVTKILAQAGQRVAKGAPLAVIASSQLARAVPDELRAEADLAAADGGYRRQRKLFDAREGTADRLEAARAAWELAKSARARARAEAALARHVGGDDATGTFTVRAPISGVVLASAAAPGAAVSGRGSGGAAELFTVGTLDRVWVLGRINAADGSRARVGARVDAEAVLLPGRVFAGRLDRISAPGPASGEVTVRCTVANPGRLLQPGMAATVAIAAARRAAAVVPSGAVVRRGGTTMVFVEESGGPAGDARFVRRAVELGRGAGGRATVRRGLAPGERVVTSGAALLAKMCAP